MSVCNDCTVEYAERMRDEGRCEHPEIEFNAKGEPLVNVGLAGYKGVAWHKRTKKWIARKTFGKAQIHLGYFDDPREAAEAWEEATNRGPSYYGVANGVVTEEAQRIGLLSRDYGAEQENSRSEFKKGPVWILRHSGVEGVRSVSCSNHQSRQSKRKSQKDYGVRNTSNSPKSRDSHTGTWVAEEQQGTVDID